MTNAAIAMVSMTRSLPFIVLARAPAPWRTGDLEIKIQAITTNTSDQTPHSSDGMGRITKLTDAGRRSGRG
jgi:hypothetical protein